MAKAGVRKAPAEELESAGVASSDKDQLSENGDLIEGLQLSIIKGSLQRMMHLFTFSKCEALAGLSKLDLT